MLLARAGGQQHAGRPDRQLQAHQCLAQQAADHFGVEVLFEHLDFATHPGGPDVFVVAGEGVAHESTQALYGQLHLQGIAHGDRIVAAQQAHDVRLHQCRRRRARRLARKQGVKFVRLHVHDLARPEAQIHQPAQEPQLVDLLARIHPVTVFVPPRQRKAVAAFPHAQQILGNAGFALDGADGQAVGWQGGGSGYRHGAAIMPCPLASPARAGAEMPLPPVGRFSCSPCRGRRASWPVRQSAW